MSTAECDEGPIVRLAPGAASIIYDGEGPHGVSWTRINFAMPLATRFTSDTMTAPWMLEAYSRVCEYEESDWLLELATAAAGRPSALAQAHHYVVYFDHWGCVEVVAPRCGGHV